MVESTLTKVCSAQKRGEYGKAIQHIYHLDGSSPEEKRKEWEAIFAWALDPNLPCSQEEFEEFLLSHRNLISDVDKKQLDRDVPRTVKWLTPQREKGNQLATKQELVSLRKILEAFIIVQNQRESAEAGQVVNKTDVKQDIQFPKFGKYTQGLNGIGLVLLKTLQGDTAATLKFLDGIANKLLPTLFQTSSDVLGQDNLVRTTEFFSALLKDLFPEESESCRKAGFETGNLATKWVMTMFSCVSLSGVDNLLGIKTVLACWDISFLAGMAGVAAVVVNLFDHARSTLSKVTGKIRMEHIVNAIGKSLRGLTPAIVYNGCIDFFASQSSNHRIAGLIASHRRLFVTSRSTRAIVGTWRSEQSIKSTPNRKYNQIHRSFDKLPELEDILLVGTGRVRQAMRKVVGLQGPATDGRSNRIAPITLSSDILDPGSKKTNKSPIAGTRSAPTSPQKGSLNQQYEKEWEDYWVVKEHEEQDVLDTARRIEKKREEQVSRLKNVKKHYCTNCRFENCKCAALAQKQLRHSAHEWLQAWDQLHSRYYYYSPLVTGYSQWEEPLCGYIRHDGVLVVRHP